MGYLEMSRCREIMYICKQIRIGQKYYVMVLLEINLSTFSWLQHINETVWLINKFIFLSLKYFYLNYLFFKVLHEPPFPPIYLTLASPTHSSPSTGPNPTTVCAHWL